MHSFQNPEFERIVTTVDLFIGSFANFPIRAGNTSFPVLMAIRITDNFTTR